MGAFVKLDATDANLVILCDPRRKWRIRRISSIVILSEWRQIVCIPPGDHRGRHVCWGMNRIELSINGERVIPSVAASNPVSRSASRVVASREWFGAIQYLVSKPSSESMVLPRSTFSICISRGSPANSEYGRRG